MLTTISPFTHEVLLAAKRSSIFFRPLPAFTIFPIFCFSFASFYSCSPSYIEKILMGSGPSTHNDSLFYQHFLKNIMGAIQCFSKSFVFALTAYSKRALARRTPISRIGRRKAWVWYKIYLITPQSVHCYTPYQIQQSILAQKTALCTTIYCKISVVTLLFTSPHSTVVTNEVD